MGQQRCTENAFFAFISESSLTQNDFDDIISSVKDLAKNVVVDEEKPVIQRSTGYFKIDQNLEGFDAKDAGVCFALDNGTILTGGEAVIGSVLSKSLRAENFKG